MIREVREVDHRARLYELLSHYKRKAELRLETEDDADRRIELMNSIKALTWGINMLGME